MIKFGYRYLIKICIKLYFNSKSQNLADNTFRTLNKYIWYIKIFLLNQVLIKKINK